MTTTAERPAPWRTGRAWRRFLVLLPVVALILGAALWWWSHPRAFEGYGAGLGAVTEVGEARYFGLGHPPRGLEILEVRPLVVPGSVDATVAAVVCVGTGDKGGVGAGDSEMVAEGCLSVREPAGPLTPDDQLLVEVRGASEGTVVVDGVAVTYRDGVRRGTEVLDFDITVGVGLGIAIEDLAW
ncbi:hypothetical protein SAMN05216184_11111 [Georgenia satyanarayanai]|uniref:Uncharacterized protein n=1 Tax=Georgenia satyanarayanai TaxID=860221 RepID=A0A2Y9C7A9_9MICO|nr:hypothetical protein [Georgenia satyanarayanai]PYF98359.1 hypothetical protein A8987_11111 [Georgenia satyanarayanai]SSA44953.1 hypothetical protein SAMN05216184_11111 [Georgenia satyanarayanai]